MRRLLRIVLYAGMAILALSLGLRIYCAWHIPRAKQLMNDMSQLRALRPFDDHIHNLITEYGFRAADPDHCNSESCDYQVTIGAPYPRVERLNNFEYWGINRLLVPLGFHPWQVWARLQVEHGRLNSTNYTFGVLDPTGFGAGGSISAKPSLEHPNEDNPNFTMGGASNYPFSLLQFNADVAPEASDLSSQLAPNFACVWGLRLCTNKFEVFPGLRDHRTKIEERRKARLAGDDPCPANHTFARTRDNDLVWIGSVLKAAGSDSLVLRQEKVLKNEYGGDIATTVHLGDSSALLFKTGSERNQRVIVFGNYYDCNVVLASPENLTEAARSLAAHPSIDRSRPRLGVSPMPTWHIPSGLR